MSGTPRDDHQGPSTSRDVRRGQSLPRGSKLSMARQRSSLSETHTHSEGTGDPSRASRQRWGQRFSGSARSWQAAWRYSAWRVLRDYQRQRRTRPLAERLKGLLLSWPLRSGWLLPYTKPEVDAWSACEERERRDGDGEYRARETELLHVLVKVLAPALQALGQKRVPTSLDEVSDVVTRASRNSIKLPIADICSIVERGRDAAWRDRQRARGARLLRETAKAQARFDRWRHEARWVLAQRERLHISPGLVAALEEETRPRSWKSVRLPLKGYLGRPSPGGERRAWEQGVGRALRRLGLSREDAETVRRCCGLMERGRRH